MEHQKASRKKKQEREEKNVSSTYSYIHREYDTIFLKDNPAVSAIMQHYNKICGCIFEQ